MKVCKCQARPYVAKWVPVTGHWLSSLTYSIGVCLHIWVSLVSYLLYIWKLRRFHEPVCQKLTRIEDRHLLLWHRESSQHIDHKHPASKHQWFDQTSFLPSDEEALPTRWYPDVRPHGWCTVFVFKFMLKLDKIHFLEMSSVPCLYTKGGTIDHTMNHHDHSPLAWEHMRPRTRQGYFRDFICFLFQTLLSLFSGWQPFVICVP